MWYISLHFVIKYVGIYNEIRHEKGINLLKRHRTQIWVILRQEKSQKSHSEIILQPQEFSDQKKILI